MYPSIGDFLVVPLAALYDSESALNASHPNGIGKSSKTRVLVAGGAAYKEYVASGSRPTDSWSNLSGGVITPTPGGVTTDADSTVWDDIVGSLISRRLSGTAGKLDYNYAENAITMQPGGNPSNTADALIFNLQYPHKAKVDGEMRLHMHWWQNSSDKIEFNVAYRVQSNFADKEEDWTTVAANSDDNSVGSYANSVSGVFNQITELCVVDMTGASISATVQFKLTRVDNTSQNIDATFIDAHIPIDGDGSRTEYAK